MISRKYSAAVASRQHLLGVRRADILLQSGAGRASIFFSSTLCRFGYEESTYDAQLSDPPREVQSQAPALSARSDHLDDLGCCWGEALG